MQALLAVVMAQLVAAPVLGGSVADFEQVFGAANDASIAAYVHLNRCAGTDVDQLVLMAPGDQVWTIERVWCDDTPRSADERFADAAQFLPADAIAGAPFTTDRGEPAEMFVSDSLGSALPVGLFHDCSGTAVPVGSLFVVADSDGGWYMGPGTCPGG